MYTKSKFSALDMFRWTSSDVLLFVILATLPVLLYEVGVRWLVVPWVPIALIGTVVAFVIGFQNNAAYGRV